MTESTLIAYLDAIDVGTPVLQRIRDEILPAMNVLAGSPIDRYHLSDQIDEATGDRQFTSFWAFTDTRMLEAKNFITTVVVDVCRFRGEIRYIEMTPTELPLPGRTRKASRLYVSCATGPAITSRLWATGSNCANLLAIVRDLLVPSVDSPRTLTD